MKLVLQIEISHDLLDVPTLVRALPQALQSVAAATKAGVAATGPEGMLLQPIGTDALARIDFRLRAEQVGPRVADLAPTAPGEPAPS